MNQERERKISLPTIMEGLILACILGLGSQIFSMRDDVMALKSSVAAMQSSVNTSVLAYETRQEALTRDQSVQNAVRALEIRLTVLEAQRENQTGTVQHKPN